MPLGAAVQFEHALSPRRHSDPRSGDRQALVCREARLRGIAEWDYADKQLTDVAPPTDDHVFIEFLGGDDLTPKDVRPYAGLGDSMNWTGHHHFCLNVASADTTVAILCSRGVTALCGHRPIRVD
jgi:hypothetical protein